MILIFGLVQFFYPDVLSFLGYGSSPIKPISTVDGTSLVRAQSFLRGPNPYGAFLLIPFSFLIFNFKKIKDRLNCEGCMSIPHIWGKLKREDTVLLKYQDIKGNWTQKWFRSFPAQIVLHEVDHLEGILFTERTLSQGQTLYKDGPNDTLEPLEI